MNLKVPREQKEAIIDRIRTYFETERSETIGALAAEQLLDFMAKEIGPYMYNQAMQDARKTVMDRLQALEDELYALEKRVPPARGN